MYVCCSRDIQNMKGKRGTYWRLFKDQWSSLSLVRATRSWAEWQNCLSKGSHQSMSRDNNRLWQFSASPSKTSCFVTHLWFSISWTWRSPSSFELICHNRTGPMRTMKGEHPRGAGGMVQKELGMICWESKFLWKSRNGRYLASSFGPRLKSESLSLPTWSTLTSWIDLLHYCFIDLNWNHLQFHNTYQSINASLIFQW